MLHFCLDRKIQMMYASSASTYGSGAHGFREEPACEEALNVYAFSKLFFDNYLRRLLPQAQSQVVGCVILTYTVRRRIIRAKWLL